MTEQTKERIIYLRKQLMIHSHLYYMRDSSVISDYAWDDMAYELKHLQESNPDLLRVGFEDDLFEDWDGSTGMHLNIDSPDTIDMVEDYLAGIEE